jgi:hypothetical protein
VPAQIHRIVQDAHGFDLLVAFGTVDQQVTTSTSLAADVKDAQRRLDIGTRCAAKNVRPLAQVRHGREHGVAIPFRLRGAELLGCPIDDGVEVVLRRN